MATAIFIVVLIILLFGTVRVPGQAEQEREHPFGTPLIWIGGVTVPIIVLGIVFLLSIRVIVAFGGPLSPSRLTIEVTRHQWWWEVRHPQQGFITANKIHIPAGRQVEEKLTSDDVIHAIADARGAVGPSLSGMGERRFVAGVLSNNSANLMHWLQDPQSVMPGNAMPNMGVTSAEARDMATYLYTLK